MRLIHIEIFVVSYAASFANLVMVNLVSIRWQSISMAIARLFKVDIGKSSITLKIWPGLASNLIFLSFSQ